MNRDFSLKERVENTRDQQQIRCVVHFNLQEIKDRFDDSIRSIENKFGTMSRKRTPKIDKF